MRSFLLLLAAATVAVAQIIATCARDNCLRAVISSTTKTGQASSDCSSFLRATVTPATTTSVTISFTTVTVAPITQTVQTTETTTASQFSTTTTTLPPLAGRNAADSGPTDHRIAAAITIAARQQTVSAVSIPKYASACSGAARYSSACSCIGVTRTTTTVGAPITLSTSISTIFVTPTVLQTQTQTQTVSTTVVVISTAPACVFSSFYLQAQGSSVDGQYVVLPGTTDETISSFSSDISNAAQFSLDSDGRLFNNGFRANTDAVPLETVFFDLPGTYTITHDLTCTRAGTTFSCVGYSADATQFQLCPSDCNNNSDPCAGVAIGTALASICQALSFTAVCAQ